MKKFLHNNWSLLLILLIILLAVILNIRPNSAIMGLDNASPFFSSQIILNRIRETSSIVYGGILFQLPLFFLLEKIDLSYQLISNIYVFSNFFFGTLGSYFLLRKYNKNDLIVLIGVLILISSMFTLWIFSHPNFLFIAAYGSIPFLLFLLTKEEKTIKEYLFLSFFTVIFLTTSLNIIAFFLYSLQIIILTKILSPKISWKFLLIWFLSMISFWFLVLQSVTILNGDTTFLLTNLIDYVINLLNNPYIPIITQGIIASEKTNSIIHTLAYSLGWTELHDINNIPVFQYYELYRQNTIFLLIGIIPSLIALASVFIDKTKKTIYLTILFVLFIFISSRYGIYIIENIPYIADSLRWASSKLWPIYIFPLLILSTKTLSKIFDKTKLGRKTLIFSLLTILLIIYSIPIITGNLLSKKTLVNIPPEYFDLPNNSKILIIPKPQKLYMREYNWGYYGSDFLSYINNSQIIDGANLYESASIYQDILENREIPNDIVYVVYDKSVKTEEEYEDMLLEFKIINFNNYYEIYERE